MSTTRRAFIGVTRTKRATAKAPGSSPSRLSRRALVALRSITLMMFESPLGTWSGACASSLARPASAAPGLAVVLLVTLERPGRGELAELVPDHRVRHEHRHVLAAVVHRERVADHVRHDHRSAGPGLDDVLGALLVLHLHLLHQVVVDERALLEAAWHLSGSLSALLAGLAAPDDHAVAFLAGAGAALRLAPRGHRVTSTRGLALTTTVRVVDRVHRDTTDGRALALPAHPAGLAPVDVRLLAVADLAEGGAAAYVDHPDLAGRHPQGRHPAFLGDQLDARAGGAGHLRAATRTQLHGVHRRADRDVAQRQVVAHLDVRGRTVLDDRSLPQVRRGEDVALLAVDVVQQRDSRGAVRVVLDLGDLGRHAVLVVPLEVDQPVRPLVPTAVVAGGDLAGVVPAALLGQRTQQRLLGSRTGELDEVGHARATTARRRRLVFADTHYDWPPKMSMRSSPVRLTIARLVSGRLPQPVRVRRRLPLRLIVLTLVTRTLNTFWTASLISVLLASGATSNVYFCSSSRP